MLSIQKYFTIMPRCFPLGSELIYTNEFTFAVAVILSAQATDKKVNQITPSLFKVADTPQKMVELGAGKLSGYIKQLSYFNSKTRYIISLSEILAKEMNDGTFPEKYHNQKTLITLPGVGQKSANVIMNVLWGSPMIGVDTHVFRLAHRFGWVKESDNTPNKVEENLVKIIPKKYHNIVNHTMVLHGRYVCVARRPKCMECPVYKWCDYVGKKI